MEKVYYIKWVERALSSYLEGHVLLQQVKHGDFTPGPVHMGRSVGLSLSMLHEDSSVLSMLSIGVH